tara:strand:+ start:137 stop:325 length:189 start_codon:yes stop_codon:yes gene_type:complete
MPEQDIKQQLKKIIDAQARQQAAAKTIKAIIESERATDEEEQEKEIYRMVEHRLTDSHLKAE